MSKTITNDRVLQTTAYAGRHLGELAYQLAAAEQTTLALARQIQAQERRSLARPDLSIPEHGDRPLRFDFKDFQEGEKLRETRVVLDSLRATLNRELDDFAAEFAEYLEPNIRETIARSPSRAGLTADAVSADVIADVIDTLYAAGKGYVDTVEEVRSFRDVLNGPVRKALNNLLTNI